MLHIEPAMKTNAMGKKGKHFADDHSSLFSSFLVLPHLLSAICACTTFGTSPPTGTCANPGNQNQDALLGSVQLTRLGICTLTLIFMASVFLSLSCVVSGFFFARHLLDI